MLQCAVSYTNTVNTRRRIDVQIMSILGQSYLYDIQTKSTIWTSNYDPSWTSAFELWTGLFFGCLCQVQEIYMTNKYKIVYKYQNCFHQLYTYEYRLFKYREL